MPSNQHGTPLAREIDGIDVRLTSPQKLVFPGITKREVFDYYLAVGPRMLDQVRDRPTALERWPEGVSDDAAHFYQKHLPKNVPDYVTGIDIHFPSGRPGTQFNPATRPAILWAVQMGAISFHPWPVTAPEVQQPDQLRIDLDPSPDNTFGDVVRTAIGCRAVLADFGMPGFVKTSGSRGLHVFAPIIAAHSFIDVRHAAIAIGRELERRMPDLVTTSWWKEERGPRIFVDFNQAAQDRSTASAYSLRAKPNAQASLPIQWDELPGLDPREFTLRTVPGIIASSADPWAGMSAAAVDLAPALEAWDRDVASGLGELPYPPDFPKMPGEPSRVQPSRARAKPDQPRRT